MRKDAFMGSWRTLLRVVLCGSLLLALPAACGRSGGTAVRLSGSSTMAPVIAELALAWRTRPDLPPLSVEAGGSGKGLVDLAGGHVEIAMVSRRLNAQERIGRIVLPLAQDRLVVIVHADNPVSRLDADSLRAIYSGRIRRWDRLVPGFARPVIVIEKAAGRGTHVAFHRALGLGEKAVRADAIVGANAEVIDAVSRSPGAIGYVSRSMLTGRGGPPAGVRAVPLPDPLARRLSRPLLLVARRPLAPAVHRVLTAFCGAQAAAHLARWGFRPDPHCRDRLPMPPAPERKP
ncbi:MAG: hypothetical protein D6740_04735 [Alphaproteobacteria bacterium]|nr:MAG: hypothetical protein D6740_04735 [Alphaproteobacteria bacterium]